MFHFAFKKLSCLNRKSVDTTELYVIERVSIFFFFWWGEGGIKIKRYAFDDFTKCTNKSRNVFVSSKSSTHVRYNDY